MSQPECLRSGLQALGQERYLEAIDRLEAFCYRCTRETDPHQSIDGYSLAHIGLIRAYFGSGDCERALALCQDVAQGSHSLSRHWADHALVSLESAPAMTWHERSQLTLPPIPDPLLQCIRDPHPQVQESNVVDAVLTFSPLLSTAISG